MLHSEALGRLDGLSLSDPDERAVIEDALLERGLTICGECGGRGGVFLGPECWRCLGVGWIKAAHDPAHDDAT
jgi:hypothetical protein